MADINVNFMHPTDGRLLNVAIDDSLTGQEAIGELLTANFIPSSNQGYKLQIKGGPELPPASSFASVGATDGATVRIIPATDAGK